MSDPTPSAEEPTRFSSIEITGGVKRRKDGSPFFTPNGPFVLATAFDKERAARLEAEDIMDDLNTDRDQLKAQLAAAEAREAQLVEAWSGVMRHAEPYNTPDGWKAWNNMKELASPTPNKTKP